MKNLIQKAVPYMLILLAIILFFPSIVFQNHTFVHTGLVTSDLWTFNYPVKELHYKALHSGKFIPFWTDLIGNGFPIFAEGQMGAVYPIQIALFVLPIPFIYSFNTFILIHYLIAGAGTYLYLTKSLYTSKKSALVGSIIFMFCGTSLTNLQHVNVFSVMAYLPFSLLLADKILEIKHGKDILKLTIIGTVLIFLQLSAGHIETFFFNMLFTGAFAILRLIISPKLRTRIFPKILTAAAICAMAILLAAPQLLSTYELIQVSQRSGGVSYDTQTNQTWPIETLISFINPHAYPPIGDELLTTLSDGSQINSSVIYPYIGVLPLIIIMYVIIKTLMPKKGRASPENIRLKSQTTLFLGLLLLTYAYALGGSTQLFAIAWNLIPAIHLFRFPSKTLYIIEFALTVLTVLGLEYILAWLNLRFTTTKTARNTIVLALGILIFTDLWINNKPIQPTLPINFWLQTPPSAQFIQKQDTNNFHNWRSYSNGIDIHGKQYVLNSQIQKETQNVLSTDYNMTQTIALNKAYAGLLIERNVLLNNNHVALNPDLTALTLPSKLKKSLDLQSVRYFISTIPVQDNDFTLQFTQRYIATYENKLAMSDSPQAKYIKTNAAYVYENKNATPRINIIPQSKAVFIRGSDPQAPNILDYILNPNFNTANSLVIEDEDPADTTIHQTMKGESTYSIESYSPERMRVHITTNTPSYFVLNDTYYPGWHALVDGREQKIYQANYAFRAVAIPQGNHMIEMYFEPTYTRIGIVLTGVGSMVLAGLFLTSLFMHKREKPEVTLNIA